MTGGGRVSWTESPGSSPATTWSRPSKEGQHHKIIMWKYVDIRTESSACGNMLIPVDYLRNVDDLCRSASLIKNLRGLFLCLRDSATRLNVL